MKKKVEILAPAGSFDSMKAAVAAGADAVYMGGSRFGARAYAENPDETGMLEAINYVHLHGRQLYMTVNTLVKEDEMDDLYDYLLPYYQAGLDAVIVQSMVMEPAGRPSGCALVTALPRMVPTQRLTLAMSARKRIGRKCARASAV